jgi:UDP-N-acetylglucosamine 2-epimerase (non-hydrolysing)
MRQKRIYIFIGTTAELVKLAPVIREFNSRKIKFTLIASGQNDIHFEEFRSLIGKVKIIRAITPKGKESSIWKFFIWTARAFFSFLVGMRSNFQGLNKSNSLFIVHGDTVSSLMGSLVAYIYRLKLVHIESGLRSYNFLEPFPEELCRHVIARLADIHFCPNDWSMKNLAAVGGEKVNTYENTLIETFWSEIKRKKSHPFVRHIQKQRKKYFVLVAHRQEHVLFNRTKTKELLKFVLGHIPRNIKCLFLVHDISAGFVDSLELLIPDEVADKITKVDRLPYGDFMHLLAGSEFLITDGGSNQEEMYYMGKPCLLLRNRTERIEGLNKNIVLSKNKHSRILAFLKHYKKYKHNPVQIKIRPSRIIADILFDYEK